MKSTPHDEGYFYCPYIPEGLSPLKYQEYLNYYSLRMFDGTTLPRMKLNPEKTILDCAQEEMQQKWPGNYQVEEFYNSKKGRLDLRLRFQDPKEETIWLLRWA